LITQKQINNILNQRIGSPEKLLMQAICSRCGFIKVTEKSCNYCTKRRAVRYKRRKEEERLGVVRKGDIDYAYDRLFKDRKIAPKELAELKYQTLLSVLHEISRVLIVSDESVSIAAYNQKRAAHIVKVLKRLEKGWAKPTKQRQFSHTPEWVELVGGEFGLSVL
jgi:hypothetical protein